MDSQRMNLVHDRQLHDHEHICLPTSGPERLQDSEVLEKAIVTTRLPLKLRAR
jgi:hypothetical protein